MIRKIKKGFTLIELVVVIAVIAILSAVSVVAYVGITNSAKKSVASQEASTVKTLLRTELTRGNYSYEASSKSIVFSFNDEKIEYVLGDGTTTADLLAGIDELVCVAQGKEKTEAASDSYIVEGEPTEGHFRLDISSSSKLVLKHYNGQEAEIFAIGAKA